MRQPMKAATLEPGAEVHDWTTFARRGDTEPEIPVSIDLSEVETLPSIKAAPKSEAEIDDAIDSCTNSARRSPYPPTEAA